MAYKRYETVNTQLECEDTLHTDAHMFLCQQLIEELPETAVVIMTHLYLKVGMNIWKGKGRSATKSEMK